MIKKIITLAIIFAVNTAVAQTTITYEYDDAGNRISRRIADKNDRIAKSYIKSSGQNGCEPDNTFGGNDGINISYCETTSSLSVGTMPGIGYIAIYTIDGKKIMYVSLPTSGGKLDLNELPDGIYTIDVICGQQHILQKIAKQTTTHKP